MRFRFLIALISIAILAVVLGFVAAWMVRQTPRMPQASLNVPLAPPPTASFSGSFNGQWSWTCPREAPPPGQPDLPPVPCGVLTVNLSQRGTAISGSYSAVALYGNRLEGDDPYSEKDRPSIVGTVSGSVARITVRSGYNKDQCSGTGIVQLTRQGADRIAWDIVTDTCLDFLPKHAVLVKQKESGVSAAYLADSAIVVSQSRHRVLQDGLCVVDITYPHIEGLPNRTAQENINATLEAQFLFVLGPDGATCPQTDLNPSHSFTDSISYDVQLNARGLLSVRYLETSYIKDAPYPNNSDKSFTFHLTDGHLYSYGELFREGSLSRIHSLVRESLQKQGITLLDEAMKRTYDFYLTNDSVVLWNLFDIHAIQGTEVRLPLVNVANIVNSAGPLPILLR